MAPCVSFDSTVDRRLVHRHANDEVFITSIHRVRGLSLWICGVRIPSKHIRMPPVGEPLPIALGLEVFRQGGMAILHRDAGIPMSHHFILDCISLAWTHKAPCIALLTPSFEAELSIWVTDATHQNGVVRNISVEFELMHAQESIATGDITVRCLSPANYRALRKHVSSLPRTEAKSEIVAVKPSGMRPETTAARSGPQESPNHERLCPNPASLPTPFLVPKEPVWTDGRGRLVVGWDKSDPMLFDHPVDHVPGMALFDSAIAAVSANAGTSESSIQSIDMQFCCFAELNDYVYVDVEATPGDTSVTCNFTQAGKDVANAVVALH